MWESAWLTNMGEYHNRFEKQLESYLDVNHIDIHSGYGTQYLWNEQERLQVFFQLTDDCNKSNIDRVIDISLSFSRQGNCLGLMNCTKWMFRRCIDHIDFKGGMP